MQRRLTRRSYLATAGLVSLAGCLGGGSGGAPERSTTAGGTGRTNAGTVAGGGPPIDDAVLPLPMEPTKLRQRAVSGGPPKDGIPSIDDPSFVGVEAAAEWLQPGDPVFGVATGDAVKAYPQGILVWHEICNDVLGGRPVAVTYCPLTGTAMGFDRGGTTFGVSGRLVNNNLIMYDRATETWWPQVLATAVPGPWNAEPPTRSLREFRVLWTTWERWRKAHPETAVLSRETGHARNYASDPYGSYNPRGGYYEPTAAPMFGTLSSDTRLEPKRVVLGARTPDGAVAFGKDRLREAGLLEGELAGTPALAAYDPALDTGYVYRNPDGASFEYEDGQVVDAGGAAHAPDDLPLQRVLAFDAMWFAWSGFYPDTTLYA